MDALLQLKNSGVAAYTLRSWQNCVYVPVWLLVVQGLLEEGNRRRKTDSTDANAASSRSHAVSSTTAWQSPLGQGGCDSLLGVLCASLARIIHACFNLVYYAAHTACESNVCVLLSTMLMIPLPSPAALTKHLNA